MNGTAKPLLYPLADCAAILGVRRSTIYQLIKQGEIRTVHIGSRHLATAESLEAYVDRLKGNDAGEMPA